MILLINNALNGRRMLVVLLHINIRLPLPTGAYYLTTVIFCGDD
jgi:hypothetical protein